LIGFASEAGGRPINYFVGGDNMDGVIAGYRALTGRSDMLPRGLRLRQSRQRYEDSGTSCSAVLLAGI